MKITSSRWKIAISAFLMIFFLAACGGAADNVPGNDGGDVPAATVDLEQITPQPADEDGATREAPEPGVPDPEEAMVARVRSDLAQRLEVDSEAIELAAVRDAEWRDAALGCPAPGSAYAQVITPGYMITLEAAGETYSYHTDRDDKFVLCGDGGQPVPAPQDE